MRQRRPDRRHRVLLVDDEPLARASLRGWLEKVDEPPLLEEAADGGRAIALIDEWQPDLVFLDIQMPGIDGFGVIRRVGIDAMPVTVFVTAFDAYAIRAFRAQALDYLLKPVTDAQLRSVYGRARKRWLERNDLELLRSFRALLEEADGADARLLDDDAPADRGGVPLDHVAIRVREGVRLVEAADVEWIEAADDYAYVHTGGSAHLVRRRLGFFEERLDPLKFVRIHRSTIVNLDFVDGFVQDSDGVHMAVLATGERLRVSRTRRRQLEARLGQSL